MRSSRSNRQNASRKSFVRRPERSVPANRCDADFFGAAAFGKDNPALPIKAVGSIDRRGAAGVLAYCPAENVR